MKKYLFLLFIIQFPLGINAQNASFGIGMQALNKKNVHGVVFTGNVRAQFSNRFGWQTEVGYASMDSKMTTIKENEIPPFNGGGTITTIDEMGSNAMTLKTSLTTKVLEWSGLTSEVIIGGGLYNENGSFYGLLSGEVFLSTQIGKNITAGIPFAFNFITWERQEFYTTGISLRFHM